MSNHSHCETEIIAQSESCTITRCITCDTYHLHIGPMTLRLKEEVFNSISDTIIHSRMMLLNDEENSSKLPLSH